METYKSKKLCVVVGASIHLLLPPGSFYRSRAGNIDEILSREEGHGTKRPKMKQETRKKRRRKGK